MLRRQFTLSALATSMLALFGLRAKAQPQYGWILDHPCRHRANAPSTHTNCVTYSTYEDALEWLSGTGHAQVRGGIPERLRSEYTIRRVEFLDPPQWKPRRPVFNVVEHANGQLTAEPLQGITTPPFVISTLRTERHPLGPRVRIAG